MEPKLSKLFRIIFMSLGLGSIVQCGVKGPPVTDREDIGPHAPFKQKLEPEKNPKNKDASKTSGTEKSE